MGTYLLALVLSSDGVHEVYPDVVPVSLLPNQGRRHQVLFGGTDSWALKPTYPQNLVSPWISPTLF